MSDKTCITCGAPVTQWPMAFRGDRACSVRCEKAAEAKDKEATRAGAR
jgi:hypothetical protein